MLTNALQLASLGYRVHPVQRNKRPILVGWPERATTDAGTIESWWGGQYQNCLIGIVTGHGSGCYVIDFDGRDGADAYEWMCERGGEPPVTVKAKTPRGFHIYGQMPAGLDIRNTTNLCGMKGVDVRGNGGYVVAPPGIAIHGTYEWTVSPNEIKPAALPATWVAALHEHHMAAVA